MLFSKPLIAFTKCSRFFITKFVTLIPKFRIFVQKHWTHITKFVTKTILYERKNYLADSKNYLAESSPWNVVQMRAETNLFNLCRVQQTLPLKVHNAKVQNKMFVESRSTIQGNGQLYSGNSIKMVNLFQDKTNPSCVNGLGRKLFSDISLIYR